MPTATLLVIRGPDQGARFELNGSETSIGRGVRNVIRILDTEVSRHHAIITREGGAFHITDRHSSNGTFLNGVAIQARKLESGDQIGLGGTTLLFSQQTAETSPVPVEIVPGPAATDASRIVSSIAPSAGRDLLERSVVHKDSPPQSLTNLELLYRISEEAVSSTLTIEQLLQRILDITLNALGAVRGCVLISDPKTSELEPRAVAVRDGEPDGRMPVSRSIVDYVIKQGEGVRTSDARADSRFAGGISIMQEGIREALCVPMPGRYELIGVLYVDTTTPADQLVEDASNVEQFNDEHLSLLTAIGRQAALAVEDQLYQAAFLKAERLATVGQTIATLSHHIKNILQGVRGGGYLIDMGLQQDDRQSIEQGWKIVEKNQDRIFHLVMDMLSYSKERQPELKPGNVNDVATDVFELMTQRAEELNVRLTLNLDENMPTSAFDYEGIHRAVLNIVGNAIDAVTDRDDAGVQIRTGFDTDSNEVCVEVEDNGPGIPEEQLSTLFNIFESTKGARGTGIGLPVSQKILREHGGDIHVDSREDHGSCFRLVWPSFDDDARAAQRPTAH